MGAQVSPFPKLDTVNEGMAPLPTAAIQSTATALEYPAKRLHIVRPSAFARTQPTALRIVEDGCLEHPLVHPAMQADNERTHTFWATLPVAPARVETPISVAKRLAHFILPTVEHA